MGLVAASDGSLAPLAKVVVSLPSVVSAPLAEAHGARAALAFLRGLGARGRRAEMTGDNLGVVRCCATTGRVKNPFIDDTFDVAFQDAALLGWDISWSAVRRRFNKDADAAAGVKEAAVRAGLGSLGPRVTVFWAQSVPTSG